MKNHLIIWLSFLILPCIYAQNFIANSNFGSQFIISPSTISFDEIGLKRNYLSVSHYSFDLGIDKIGAFPGTPTSILLNGNFYAANKVRIGFDLLKDKAGALHHFNVGGRFNYLASDHFRLAIGIHYSNFGLRLNPDEIYNIQASEVAEFNTLDLPNVFRGSFGILFEDNAVNGLGRVIDRKYLSFSMAWQKENSLEAFDATFFSLEGGIELNQHVFFAKASYITAPEFLQFEVASRHYFFHAEEMYLSPNVSWIPTDNLTSLGLKLGLKWGNSLLKNSLIWGIEMGYNFPVHTFEGTTFNNFSIFQLKAFSLISRNRK